MSAYYIEHEDGRVECVADAVRWARWFETAERSVANTVIGDVRVSTVFLGIDHGFSFDTDAPILWETLVFGGPLDGEMDRYASRIDAVCGHAAMVARARAAL